MTCSWMSSEMPQRQCRWPGVFSSSVHGDHRWKCYWQNSLTGEGKSAGQVIGNRIVGESHDWDGSAESYIERRFAQRVSPPGMDAHAGGEGMGQVQAKVEGVVSPLRVSECLSDLDELLSR